MAARRPVIIVLIILVVLLPAVSLVRCQGDKNIKPGGTVTVTIAGKAFKLEIAADQASITQGLMGRESIPDGTGMIFIMPDAQYRGFWMKNCLTDMDIVFLDARGYVTATHHMVTEPPQQEGETLAAYEARLKRYQSGYPAQFALELPPGSVEQLNVRFEDRINLDLERLKALAR